MKELDFGDKRATCVIVSGSEGVTFDEFITIGINREDGKVTPTIVLCTDIKEVFKAINLIRMTYEDIMSEMSLEEQAYIEGEMIMEDVVNWG